ncbi:hypothetical protein PFISCL1PPCAC_8637 [Pristionchus fissidentatus]|uniref:G protein-coupled receptor n=1 Tax=Pristionchus fissidentatus TaxID=1538716 RepID=A0AAV5VCB7_9BILA|nr:hypothetical protein PFISCL1PPCAC_8637 [Pristionchus fissidentatus]
MMRAADAPSVRNEALAAVTVPWGLTKAGLRVDSFSRVETRIPLSALTVTGFFPSTKTGTISLILPPLAAASASVCERIANSSCSLLLTPNVAASRSPECPIVSPEVNSATAGSSGESRFFTISAAICNLAMGVFAFWMPSIALRACKLYLMGTSDSSSVPPAITAFA